MSVETEAAASATAGQPKSVATPAPASSRLSPAEMRSQINRRMNADAEVRDRRSAPRSKARETKKPGFFARLFSSRGKAASREERQGCCIVGVLMLLDRGLGLDGLVLEIGENTLLFRQGATYIFDRTGAEVSIRFSDYEKRGRVLSVSERGYVIGLFEPLAPYQINALLERHGLPG